MRVNGIAVANYLIELAKRDGVELRLLGLVKRVYLAHGFSLAGYGRGLLDPRFDRVEAWRYGPVIPSVYHSFKHNRRDPITEFGVIGRWDEALEEEIFEVPQLSSPEDKSVVEFVWDWYKNFKDSDLVSILHKEGTPWRLVYEEGKNMRIDDHLIKTYYELYIKQLRKLSREGRI